MRHLSIPVHLYPSCSKTDGKTEIHMLILCPWQRWQLSAGERPPTSDVRAYPDLWAFILHISTWPSICALIWDIIRHFCSYTNIPSAKWCPHNRIYSATNTLHLTVNVFIKWYDFSLTYSINNKYVHCSKKTFIVLLLAKYIPFLPTISTPNNFDTLTDDTRTLVNPLLGKPPKLIPPQTILSIQGYLCINQGNSIYHILQPKQGRNVVQTYI